MSKQVILTLLGILALGNLSLAQGKKITPLKVCLVSGSLEYDSDKTLPILQNFLEEKYHAQCSRAFRKDDKYIPGLENLKTCDVMVLFTRRLTPNPEQLEVIKEYCLSGKPIVGIRTASHAFQNWLDLDKVVFGGNYKGHFGPGSLTQIHLVEKAKGHPVLNGFKPFASEGTLYKNTGLAKDCEVLLTGTIPGQSEPVAWTRNYKGGRIFYTSLGHQKDFENSDFLLLLANAVHWVAKRPMTQK